MKKFLIICISLIAFSFSAFAQELVEVKGVVVDKNNEPLIGVNITVKDTPGLGTVTDVDGKYTMKVGQYKTLVFSYVGYDKIEVMVKDNHQINVTMKESDSSVLNEVVVLGTGRETKQTLTGAVSTVDPEILKSNPSASITNALAGNVAGVMARSTSGQPGKNFSEFWIRGISTFGAGTGAYVLVDGFERDLNDINIEDIETFSVLKDASVTAIYGAKGANGVVLITTKRGKEGKINIDAKLETTYNTRTITPEFLDGYSYANLANEAKITRNQEAIYSPEELEILRLGLDPDLYPNVNWKEKLLKEGAMQYRANLNMSGGGSTARYFVSASYVEEEGMYKTDKALENDYNTNANYSRWNYRLNTDINITKSTLLKVGVSGSLAKRNSPGLGDDSLWEVLYGFTPTRMPFTYSNGRFPAIADNLFDVKNINNANIGNRTNPWVVATQTGYNENWQNNIQTNITLEQNFDFITKGLRFVGNFGFDTNNSNDVMRHKVPELWRAERARNPQTGELVFSKAQEPIAMGLSSVSTGDRREFFDMMLNYDRGFGGHNIGGALKYTQDNYRKTIISPTYNLVSDNNETIAFRRQDDLKIGVPKRNQNLAGRATYNYNLRYFVDFNFGYSGSENFAIGHQYGFFPAVSGAWNIGEEAFVKNSLEWVNQFKVRYSWGKVGNDNLGDDNRFPYLSTISGGATGYQWADFGIDKYYPGMRYSQVASPYVTWEVATKQDLGLDVSVFGDKFNANVDYFYEKRTGIYMPRNFLPAMVGLESTPKANVGEVTSEGFDGRFAFKHKVSDVNLTLRGNITYSKNVIVERDEEYNVYAYQYEKGHRVDQVKGLVALGMFKDYDEIRNSPKQTFGDYQPGDLKYKDVNGDGVIDNGDRVAIGATSRPNLIYGIGASANWKGLDVNVHFQGAGKSTFVVDGMTARAFSYGDWGNVLKDAMGPNRWISADISGDPSTENPNASYPRLSYGDYTQNNYQSSSFWLKNGQYIRLKTVDVGYTLPKQLVNKIHCNNIRIFAIGTNLLTWSEFKLWDPELGSVNGEKYPLAKSVTLGLSINL